MTVEEAIKELKDRIYLYRKNWLGDHWEIERYLETYEVAIEALEKVEEYKRLEEQGLLLRLPCKVGDTVYEIWGQKVVEGIVWCIRPFVLKNEIEFRGNVSISVEDPFWKDGRLVTYNLLAVFNEDTFFTREEAEQKLKEL